jgi:annexin A7/11
MAAPAPAFRLPPYPNAAEDAKRLADAFSAKNQDLIIEILAPRKWWDLVHIRLEFEAHTGKNLVEVIHETQHFSFKDLLIALVTPLPQFKAEAIHKALSGITTNEHVLTDVLTQSTNDEIHQMKYVYVPRKLPLDKDVHHLYYPSHLKPKVDPNKTTNLDPEELQRDVEKETSHHYQKLLLTLLAEKRSEDPNVDEALAIKDAEGIFKKGEGRLGTDDNFFIEVLATRSPAHLQAVSKNYRDMYGHSLDEGIKKETSGAYQKALRALALPKATYWAERVHDAVAGLGTNDTLLQFVFVANHHATRLQIAEEYHKVYNKNMVDDVAGDTSGHYRQLLLALLKQP